MFPKISRNLGRDMGVNTIVKPQTESSYIYAAVSCNEGNRQVNEDRNIMIITISKKEVIGNSGIEFSGVFFLIYNEIHYLLIELKQLKN